MPWPKQQRRLGGTQLLVITASGVLQGQVGDDLMDGGDGNDFLSGGFGDDRFIGGPGS
jgi:Ca2+-binding RTX toxin-like protein